MAVQLAEMGASDEFHPELYRDEVAERTRELIQKKIDGEEITTAEGDEPKAQVIDLMEALKASLAGAPRPSRTSKSGSAKLPIKAEQHRKPAKPAPRKVAAARAKSR